MDTSKKQLFFIYFNYISNIQVKLCTFNKSLLLYSRVVLLFVLLATLPAFRSLLSIDKKVSVPKIEINYKAKINPNMFEVIGHLHSWLQKNSSDFEINDAFVHHMTLYMSYSYPNANFKQLFWICKTSLVSFTLDDMLEKVNNVKEANKNTDQMLELFFKNSNIHNQPDYFSQLVVKSAELFQELEGKYAYDID